MDARCLHGGADNVLSASVTTAHVMCGHREKSADKMYAARSLYHGPSTHRRSQANTFVQYRAGLSTTGQALQLSRGGMSEWKGKHVPP